jgi:uncharacterized protein (DUF2252 family)
MGRERRARVPLEAHAAVPDRAERRDPSGLLRSQESDRQQSLIPLRHQRMGADPFAFLRGAAIVMASDLSLVPCSGIDAVLCGDAHLANFGLFASAEGTLVFDLNDFDETSTGPFEWDVKRLAASIVVAARWVGLSRKQARRAVLAEVRAYRQTVARLAELPVLTAWAAKVDVKKLERRLRETSLSDAMVRASGDSRARTNETAAVRLTERAHGGRRFRSDPPILMPVPEDERAAVADGFSVAYAEYLRSLPIDRVALLARFSFVDMARKVVGVGSVGTFALLLLLESGDGDSLMLQLKQADKSVLAPYVGPGAFANQGRRVVSGQKVMQAAGDPFLGWCHGGDRAPFDFYVRQLHDRKSSIELRRLDKDSLLVYSALCGGVLARAHARVGDAAVITGYLGEGKEFDHAIADFADAYAELNDHDYAGLRAEGVLAT